MWRETAVNLLRQGFTRFSRALHYRHEMKLLPIFMLASLCLIGCATNPTSSTPYPLAYQQALKDFPGSAETPAPVIDEFVDFLSKLGAADTATRAAQLYAATLHFSDALMLTSRRDKVVEHFAGLVLAGTGVEVEILQTLQRDADVYLVWAMSARFQPLRKTVTSNTIGITHLRFNSLGQVILHQDFWDTGLGFYQHIPALGRVIKGINGRFAVEDSQE